MAEDKKRKKNAAAAKALLERLEAEAGNGGAGGGGYDTDAGPSSSSSSKKKVKTRKRAKTPTEGYETDDGYTSAPENRKKSGKKFFRLGNKSKSQLDENIPQTRPTSPTPQFRLPIAERFATTLFDANANTAVTAAAVEPPPLPPLLPPSAFTSPTKPELAKKTVIRFASVTSESSSSGSSSGGLSRFTSTSSSSASSVSSPTASSHQQRPLSPTTTTTSPKKSRPDPLSLLSPNNNNGTGAKSTPNSRAPSPSPTGSPFVVLTPSDPSAPIPSEPPPSSNLTRSKTRLTLKIGQKTTEPPKRPVISSPIQVAEPQSAIETRRRDTTLEPAPNTYSIYELPPPSPPPESSLPKVPPPPSSSTPGDMPSSSSTSSSSSRTLYQTPTPSRSVSPSPFSQPVKRGVESPFPSRPILPVSRGAGAGGGGELVPPRYRDLPGYTPSRPTSPAPHLRPDLHSLDTQGSFSSGGGLNSAPAVLRQPTPNKRTNRYAVSFAPPSKSGGGMGISIQGASDDDESEYEDEGYEDEVLNRFIQPRRSNEREREPALGRNRSIEAKSGPRPRPRPRQQPKSAPLPRDDDRDTMYSDDGASRYSFMDQEKSENARQRFVERIERMFDSNGREIGGPGQPQLKPREMGVPPVPKLPEGIRNKVVVVRPVGSEGRSGWF